MYSNDWNWVCIEAVLVTMIASNIMNHSLDLGRLFSPSTITPLHQEFFPLSPQLVWDSYHRFDSP